MFNKQKVFRNYEDIPQTQRNQFNLTKYFKTESQYKRFIKLQEMKRKMGLFFWSPNEKILSIGEGRTVSFYKAKML